MNTRAEDWQLEAGSSPIGILLRELRGARRMSQLALAMEAGISARHLSYVETGKSQASRQAVCALADVLKVSLRERNALLVAAGYAPVYQESTLGTPALERMRHAIDLIISHQEPYPAFVLDRHWNVLMANQAAKRINDLLMDGRSSRHENILYQVFDPDDFRAVIANWPEVAEKFIRHAHEQLAAFPSDPVLRRLVSDVLQYPGVPEQWRRRDVMASHEPVLTIEFRSREGPLRFFETITTFSMPRDVTLDELRIESAFPADDLTAEVCARLAANA